jgi:hypothetical protein
MRQPARAKASRAKTRENGTERVVAVVIQRPYMRRMYVP